ncbi:MAG: hypothetical protein GYB68_03445 [Chloroflexi bacterium]|nr:hypothetical protein [Chloroflexota bacterium]
MRILFVGDSLTEALPGCSYVDRVCHSLPQVECFNLGLRNDTVISLTKRLERSDLPRELDWVVVWVGVNDVPCNQHWSYRVGLQLLSVETATDLATFEHWYQRLLALLKPLTRRIMVGSSMFKGENLPRPCNDQLDQQAVLIQRIARADPQVTFLDIRSHLVSHLNGHRSAYRSPTAYKALWEALTVRSQERIDQLAAARRLQLTFDGLHLNSRGAELVANLIVQAIESQTTPLDT